MCVCVWSLPPCAKCGPALALNVVFFIFNASPFVPYLCVLAYFVLVHGHHRSQDACSIVLDGRRDHELWEAAGAWVFRGRKGDVLRL